MASLQASANVASICANDSPITLGGSSSGNYFDGALDEVELYTEGKTATDVASLSQKPVFYTSSYRAALDGSYARLDESDYQRPTISCVANASNDFDCPGRRARRLPAMPLSLTNNMGSR